GCVRRSDGGDGAITAPLGPGEGVFVADALVSCVPPCRVGVGVAGDLVGAFAGAVGDGDLVDDVFVEPVGDVVVFRGRFPDDGEATLLVRFGGWCGRGCAVFGGVDDVDLAASVGVNGGQARADQSRDVVAG